MASSSEIRVKAGLPRPYSIFPTKERLYAVSGARREDSRRAVYSDRRAAHRCVLRPDGGTTHRSVLDSDGRTTHRCVLRIYCCTDPPSTQIYTLSLPDALPI